MIFTLGHSTLSTDEFITAARRIDVIIDVRSHPGSNHVPQFNKESMAIWLQDAGIKYEWWPELGGWSDIHLDTKGLVEEMAEFGVDITAYARGAFPKQRIAAGRSPVTANQPEWTNQGLYDYSFYMTLLSFLSTMDVLVSRYHGTVSQGKPNCALVCAEALWWKCHRSMIADYLDWQGIPCFHLPSHPPKRQATPWYKKHDSKTRINRYRPEVLEAWETWDNV